MNSVADIAYQNTLFDLYSSLLTPRQKHLYELYYFEDLSLQEIAEELKISRNAVHSTLNKVIQYLHDYEAKLQFNEKINIIQRQLNDDGYVQTEKIIAMLKK